MLPRLPPSYPVGEPALVAPDVRVEALLQPRVVITQPALVVLRVPVDHRLRLDRRHDPAPGVAPGLLAAVGEHARQVDPLQLRLAVVEVLESLRRGDVALVLLHQGLEVLAGE